MKEILGPMEACHAGSPDQTNPITPPTTTCLPTTVDLPHQQLFFFFLRCQM